MTLNGLITVLEEMGYKVLIPVDKPYSHLETFLVFNTHQFVRWSFSSNLLKEEPKTITEQIFAMLLRFDAIGEIQ